MTADLPDRRRVRWAATATALDVMALPIGNKLVLRQARDLKLKATRRNIRQTCIDAGGFRFDDRLTYQHGMWLK
ncbi:hypothetical protein P7L78_17545 [Tistrella bauzanensis]|uniref:hypothetical protein n=1 Tax=Tistrella TaxID=171436 RepID=UPI0031F5F6BC